MTQSTSDFGFASLIFVAPLPPFGALTGRYALGPGESLARKITQSISDFGLALENLPPPGLKYLPEAGKRGFIRDLGGFVKRSKVAAGNGLTFLVLFQCPGPNLEGGIQTAPSTGAGLDSCGARPLSLEAEVLLRLFLRLRVLEEVVVGRFLFDEAGVADVFGFDVLCDVDGRLVGLGDAIGWTRRRGGLLR
tara:strand:- start:33 stop:608 length:576 start_codon:yes stop_codon:yes gene_type:complete